ncbi:unnamed protein product [Ceutorhynchus assimilis]|uniref:Tudor domain-containing protein n=1 Tax=Ceutorhynchus assimilis TaxID=467358 RepID=A0A9N9QLA8_9CUCU|nr:unnamed protein product [Ceutorhynchus assimilis]
MAPHLPVRQLLTWSLPSVAILLSYLWYKKRRIGAPSDSGGGSEEQKVNNTVSDQTLIEEEEEEEETQDQIRRRNSSGRDSANHSPCDLLVTASPSLSFISDNHSEGSNDSGKGCSDAATPPPSSQADNVSINYEFVIPQNLVGKLIGRQGVFVQRIKEKCNAEVYLKLIEGINNDTILSCMVAPDHLFMQQPTHPAFQSLAMLSNCMNHCYESQPDSPLLPTPIPENTVCVAYSEGAWYRAVVLSSDKETESSYIKFLDYGGYCYVENDKLRQIRQDFMLLPFQAAECFLANVKPKTDRLKREKESLLKEAETLELELMAENNLLKGELNTLKAKSCLPTQIQISTETQTHHNKILMLNSSCHTQEYLEDTEAKIAELGFSRHALEVQSQLNKSELLKSAEEISEFQTINSQMRTTIETLNQDNNFLTKELESLKLVFSESYPSDGRSVIGAASGNTLSSELSAANSMTQKAQKLDLEDTEAKIAELRFSRHALEVQSQLNKSELLKSAEEISELQTINSQMRTTIETLNHDNNFLTKELESLKLVFSESYPSDGRSVIGAALGNTLSSELSAANSMTQKAQKLDHGQTDIRKIKVLVLGDISSRGVATGLLNQLNREEYCVYGEKDGTWPQGAYDLVANTTKSSVIYTQIADYTPDRVPLVLCYVILNSKNVIFINQKLVDEGYADWVEFDETALA